jgi:hypothetical protein
LYLWHAEIVATFGQKRAAFFTLFYQSKTVSSQFLFQPICPQGGIWSFELIDRLLSVSDDELTNRSGPRANCIRSLLLLQAGEFDRSHSIVQGMTGADAAYIHGMIHRVEGDYSNAGYWFRQALADPFYRGLPTDPIQITEAVAKARTLAPDADVVESLQAEFESLLRSLM